MISKQIHFNSFSESHFFPQERSLQGWLAISGFLLLSVVSYFAGAAALLRLVYPVTALAVGIFLYLRHPILYIGFTWWIWFLTPLAARLVDYRIGWDPTRQMLIAPYLVVFVTIATFLRHSPRASTQGSMPFVLPFIAVFYGLLIGLVHNSPLPVVRGLLDWLSPILFAFHLFINWRDYPSYRQNIQRIFIWAVLLLSIYAIYQFVVAPEWDRYWLIESKMYTSSGSPEPFGMRVWSTLHSPGPFASLMQTGLLLLFTSSGSLILPASALGYLSFLLTQVRSSWLGWLLGIVMIFGSVKAHLQMRLMAMILIIIMSVIRLTNIEPSSNVVTNRLETFSELEKDTSFNERSESYERNLNLALSNLLGNGLGNTWTLNEKTGELEVFVLDSGILDMFFTLGWVGAIPYLAGVMLIIFSVFQYAEARFDSFVSTARAISITFCVQLVGYSTMIGLSGMIMWGFLAMAMAAHKYYQHQNTQF